MRCPFCGEPDTKVSDSRTVEEGVAIRRRRLCDCCGGRFTTYERADMTQFMVVKRGGEREVFDRSKIFKSVMRACNKRIVTVEQVERLAAEVETHCANLYKKEVDSSEIGEVVMKKLRELDEVAYVRFASVYRQFKDIDSFMDELAKLLSDKK